MGRFPGGTHELADRGQISGSDIFFWTNRGKIPGESWRPTAPPWMSPNRLPPRYKRWQRCIGGNGDSHSSLVWSGLKFGSSGGSHVTGGVCLRHRSGDVWRQYSLSLQRSLDADRNNFNEQPIATGPPRVSPRQGRAHTRSYHWVWRVISKVVICDVLWVYGLHWTADEWVTHCLQDVYLPRRGYKSVNESSQMKACDYNLLS